MDPSSKNASVREHLRFIHGDSGELPLAAHTGLAREWLVSLKSDDLRERPSERGPDSSWINAYTMVGGNGLVAAWDVGFSIIGPSSIEVLVRAVAGDEPLVLHHPSGLRRGQGVERAHGDAGDSSA